MQKDPLGTEQQWFSSELGKNTAALDKKHKNDEKEYCSGKPMAKAPVSSADLILFDVLLYI